MSKRRDGHLPRLSIAPTLNMQQPVGGGGMFSPALPTGLQQSFHPAFIANPLQTPMQSFFHPGLPAAPVRPTHNPNQASIQLAAAGIHPPNFMTPVATHFPRPSMMLAPGQIPPPNPHPFPNRNRRQLSIGGPPKAVLGGPARKLSPLPATSADPKTPANQPPEKKKKVNLPKETIVSEDGQSTTRPSWARTPLPLDTKVHENAPIFAESSTAAIYPPDNWRHELPNSIDVYLPGKTAWEAMKQRTIEEKLERLGVGSGSNVPNIHAPHARAASISSPADPALLLFKLNKLQRAQDSLSSGQNSLSVSPQPPFAAPFGLSPSPHNRLISNRHGHTMSLAQPPSYQSSLFSGSPQPFGTFGPNNGTVGQLDHEYDSSDGIHRPQGRVPIAVPEFIPAPISAVGAPKEQIDFARGFGLDVPLESEEEEVAEAESRAEMADDETNDGDQTQDMELEERYGGEIVELDDGTTTAPQSRLHSRHVSKLSAALSLRSVGGNFQAQFQSATEVLPENGHAIETHVQEEQEAAKPVDPAAEWTGSEDVYLGAETSDDESIGEFSNPSDEEKARQARNDRRLRRKAARSQQTIDQPRRIPPFPRPPDNTHVFHSAPREDDIISNPSEENLHLGRRADFLGIATEEYYPDSASLHAPANPHSRVASGQYSAHDPAMAHSRETSDNFVYPTSASLSGGFHQSQPSAGRRDLNPFAKPFVFGAPRSATSGSWQHLNGDSTPPMPVPNVSTHSRLPSLGKPLSVTAPEFKPGGFNLAAMEFKPLSSSGFNVAAPEFKPGPFNFRLPGAPAMPQPAPSFPHPQLVEEHESSPLKVQGREKRQRRDSHGSVEEEGDSMTSFRFPPPSAESSPQAIRGHRSERSEDIANLNQDAEPFTFANFSAVANKMPAMGSLRMPEPEVIDVEEDEGLNDESTTRDDASQPTLPSSSKAKRAPIPLDFKHPASGNTVPAGLFKALVSGDDRTRRGVRSRLDSREIFEHGPKHSIDDNNVPPIAHKKSRQQLRSPEPKEDDADEDEDVFTSARHNQHHQRRRSSLPDALRDNESDISSVAPQDLTTRMEIHHVEGVISQLLDEKLSDLRADLAAQVGNASRGEAGVSSATEKMLADVMSLFRAQLQESAAKSLEDSQMDARGELDLQLVENVVQQSHQELLAAFQREASNIVKHIPMANGNSNHAQSADLVSTVDAVGKRTVHAIVEAFSELSARQEAVALNAPSRERDLIVEKVVNALSPMIDSVQQDPIDYEFLTRELTQAVKPHISQLIDLASDKRETAGLIVDRILPHLSAIGQNVSVDTDAITHKLITEVRRAIAPIDAFEIKEQVADLVVERLDSRLAVRDKTFNVDILTAKVKETVAHFFESIQGVPGALEQLAAKQNSVEAKYNELAAGQKQVLTSVSEVPQKVGSQLGHIKAAQQEILKKLETPLVASAAPSEADPNILVIKTAVESLVRDQKSLAQQQTQDAALQSKVLSDKLNTLPETFTGIVTGLQNSLTEFIKSGDTSKRELEELRKLNTEYQVQVTKARSSHGQVRVEKDMLSEKLGIVENDRDRLRAQVKELQTAATDKVSENSALEARNKELEEALSKALARLQSADVATQSDQRKIADLEKANKELSAEKESLKTKVAGLEVEIVYGRREQEIAAKNLEAARKQSEQSLSQQGNWEALMAATEKINLVYKLLEDDDQHELRQQREHVKAVENENAALQKRMKDSEAKVANAEKAANTARQTLNSAQQRSAEWERRAKDYEGQLEMLRTKFEQAEQTQAQLETDYNLAKMQIEEQEAESRLVRDGDTKLREQISALENKCTLLQKELEKANAASKLAAKSSPAPFKPLNGNVHTPARPDSRASTIYGADGVNGRSRVSSYANNRTAPSIHANEPSVWDSMHAPSSQNGTSKWAAPSVNHSMHSPAGRFTGNYVPSTPKPRRPNANAYAPNNSYRAPSPTPSNVSAAPTQGDDGWWS